mgnify:CR=1 FL=1
MVFKLYSFEFISFNKNTCAAVKISVYFKSNVNTPIFVLVNGDHLYQHS